MTNKQIAIISGIIIPIVGIAVTLRQPNNRVLRVNASPDSVNIAGDNNTVNTVDHPKPKIELKPFEINIPNSNLELGFDSEYLIEITSDYTIATFPLKIKLPESVLTEYISLFNDDARGERAWYNDFELKDGYATFAHKNPEQLTIDDITW